jgi:hypothetical protein
LYLSYYFCTNSFPESLSLSYSTVKNLFTLHFRFISDPVFKLTKPHLNVLSGNQEPLIVEIPFLLIANLTLPQSPGYGSISTNSNLQIASAQPYILALFPINPASIYSQGDRIIIMARFNRPVQVIGIPSLILRTGVNRVGVALYLPFFSFIDELLIDINLEGNEILFEYTVQQDDNIAQLTHNSTLALQLTNNSRILSTTSKPQQQADILLADPDDLTTSVVRQWAFRYPLKVSYSNNCDNNNDVYVYIFI